MIDIEKLKTDQYKKNINLEHILHELNSILSGIDEKLSEKRIKNKYPTIFIVGCPRSGTTLLSQWLASLKLFCYPTNFLSRFYQSPYVGSLIQEMLFNPVYRYKNELKFLVDELSYTSDVGKTPGILEPHEFWYFWRLYFQFQDIPVSLEDFNKSAQYHQFQKQIYLIQNVFERPLFLKSLIINPYIKGFLQNIDRPIFLFIKRDPVENIKSILSIRNKYFGNDDIWFSFKPKEYSKLKSLDKYSQVAGQVYGINMDLQKSLKEISDVNKIEVNYEQFCEDPKKTHTELIEKLNRLGCGIQSEYSGIEKFSVPKRADDDEDRFIKTAYQNIQKYF